MNKDKIDADAKNIRIVFGAEKGFDPHTELDINSLRFGASEEVNFGRGSKVQKTKILGQDPHSEVQKYLKSRKK